MTVRIRPTSKHAEFNQTNTTWPAQANQIDAKKMNVSDASLAPDSSVRKATPSDITERTARSGAVVETIFLSRPQRAQCTHPHTYCFSPLFFSLIQLCRALLFTCIAALKSVCFIIFMTVFASRTTSIMPTFWPVARQPYGIMRKSRPSCSQMESMMPITCRVSMSWRRSETQEMGSSAQRNRTLCSNERQMVLTETGNGK